MQEMTMSVRIRLSVMMFLQYMMFAGFWVPLSAYLTELQMNDTLKWLTLSSMALGCLVSPIFCMIADRHFASQKVLIVLNFLCAILFFLAAKATEPMMLFIFLLLAMFCYMPTWSLTNAIAMSNAPSEKFPHIRVFGSIGWVAAGIFSLVAIKFFTMQADGETVPLKIDNTPIPLMCGAVTAVIAAIVNFTLPDTPPPAKGQKASVIDALGLRALTLMKDFNFAIFIILSMLVVIPFTLYFSLGAQFFDSQGFKLVTVTMNWGQLVEMGIMLLVPLALARFGVKWTILIGLAALLVRYVALWGGVVSEQLPLYYIAILVHGVIFGFFFVGGQVYVDKKAPAEIRAQAQGLIFLICFGIGMLAGNFINVKLIAKYSTDGVCDWGPVFMITTIMSAVLLAAFFVFFRDDVSTKAEAAAVEEAVEA
jgi:nucleoside transporter